VRRAAGQCLCELIPEPPPAEILPSFDGTLMHSGGIPDMKLTFAVALACGFVLAMALAFGGHALNGPHLRAAAIERSPADFGAAAR
jgi:hypothetical protein